VTALRMKDTALCMPSAWLLKLLEPAAPDEKSCEKWSPTGGGVKEFGVCYASAAHTWLGSAPRSGWLFLQKERGGRVSEELVAEGINRARASERRTAHH